MDDACNIARKWLPPITEEDKKTVHDIIYGSANTLGVPFLHRYLAFLKPYVQDSKVNAKLREGEILASGASFFYGCFFYIMHFPNWRKHIYDIFLYNLLYMLVDHYIDDNRINDK